ncbi:protein ImuA [Sphingomonas sp. ID1715]|nr:protein ImuA [Sphingomonas sp. ID1715]
MRQSMRLEQLRAEVRAIAAGGKDPAAALPFGLEALDGRIAGGGLADAGLHEAAGASCGYSDDAAATLFLAGIAGRRAGERGTVLWVVSRRDLFAPGLALAGLPPERLLIAEAGRDEDVLAVMEEGLRHGALAAVVGEVGRAGLTETRRLQLAAEEGGTMALMLRRWRKADPLAEPSTAITRWRIGPAPSVPLPTAGVGPPCWTIELARQRGGPGFSLITEACDAQGRLALPALSPHRPDQADGGEWRRAA